MSKIIENPTKIYFYNTSNFMMYKGSTVVFIKEIDGYKDGLLHKQRRVHQA